MTRPRYVLVLLWGLLGAARAVDVGGLGAEIAADCWDEGCARGRLLEALGGGTGGSLPRALASQVTTLHLPEAALGARLIFRPGRGLDFDVEFPPNPAQEERATSKARDMMKQKMLMPLLMLVKLKLKLLTPILLTLVGIKAMKALVLSKLAILLVVGFLIVQLCQKLGMGKMTMSPGGAMEVTPMPPPMYGPPTTSGYEAPPPASSWEPAAPYSRIYEPSASHQMAYSAYAPSNN